MYSEDELLPISALQHLAFCERQWALIHLEEAWQDNVLTVEGKQLHEKAHESDSEYKGNVKILRSLRIRSFKLGLVGQADVVEFEETAPGNPMVRIIEYKRGRPKIGHCDEVQICAQAICLEEMLGLTLSEGYFFYGKPRRRHLVVFSTELRQETERLAIRLHELTARRITPKANYGKHCESCSLKDICLPESMERSKRASRYLKSIIDSSLKEDIFKEDDE
jgi:CRISPR-associated exonuclease Cas4